MISRLWGKSVTARLVRMDHFIHNLGLVLSDFTGATGQLSGSLHLQRIRTSDHKIVGKRCIRYRLVRMDRFIHNLGLVLCDSIGATVQLNWEFIKRL